MKKNVDIININLTVLNWLIDKLKESIDNTEVYDLTQSLKSMADGLTESIILELDDGNNNNFNSKQIKCGDLSIYIQSRRVIRGSEEIQLTPKEFDILYFLAVNRGEVFTKEQIYKAVWEDDYLLDDSNIMAFIRKLRKKIEINPDDPKYILTIWGIGYKFADNL